MDARQALREAEAVTSPVLVTGATGTLGRLVVAPGRTSWPRTWARGAPAGVAPESKCRQPGTTSDAFGPKQRARVCRMTLCPGSGRRILAGERRGYGIDIRGPRSTREHRPRQRARRARESDLPHPGDRRRLTGLRPSDSRVDRGSVCGREFGRVPRTHGAGIRDRFPPAVSGCRRRLHQTPAGDADRLLTPRDVFHSPPAGISSVWTPNAPSAPPVHWREG